MCGRRWTCCMFDRIEHGTVAWMMKTGGAAGGEKMTLRCAAVELELCVVTTEGPSACRSWRRVCAQVIPTTRHIRRLCKRHFRA